MGVKFPGKKRYVTLEWPLSSKLDTGREKDKSYMHTG